MFSEWCRDHRSAGRDRILLDIPGMPIDGWASPQWETSHELEQPAGRRKGCRRGDRRRTWRRPRHDVLVTVLLTKDYEPHHPPGYPFRIAHGVPLVPAGAVLDLLKPEAAALVAAGAATYGEEPPPATEPPANVTPPYCGGPSGGDTEPVGTTLTCTKGTWSNADDVQTAYSWERDGETIEGATTDEYRTGDDDEDCALRCWVRSAMPSSSSLARSRPTWPSCSTMPSG